MSSWHGAKISRETYVILRGRNTLYIYRVQTETFVALFQQRKSILLSALAHEMFGQFIVPDWRHLHVTGNLTFRHRTSSI